MHIRITGLLLLHPEAVHSIDLCFPYWFFRLCRRQPLQLLACSHTGLTASAIDSEAFFDPQDVHMLVALSVNIAVRGGIRDEAALSINLYS